MPPLYYQTMARDEKYNHPVYRVAHSYGVAVLSAWGAETCTYPLDLTKTRLQIQSEIAASKHGLKVVTHGMLRTVIKIGKEEGFFKLWSGFTPMLQRHAIYSGSRLVIYEKLRFLITDGKSHLSAPVAALCGAGAGALAQLISSPTDLVKIQMQAEGRRRLQGLPPRILNTRQAYRLLFKESGTLGLWRGALPNVQRAALVNLGDLGTYDRGKRYLMEDLEMSEGILVHFLAAYMAGFAATVLGTPADVMKTRLMNQPVGKDGRGLLYKGMIDCCYQSVKNEGFLSLYRGFVPVWVRLGPWALIYWMSYEYLIDVTGGTHF